MFLSRLQTEIAGMFKQLSQQMIAVTGLYTNLFRCFEERKVTSFLYNNDNRIQSLDGWRALSILLVIVGHLGVGYQIGSNRGFGLFYHFSNHNYALNGVNTFFVISGFLISNILLREKNNTDNIALGKFYLRRTIRIFPVYYFYLIVIAGLTVVFRWPLSYLALLQCVFYLTNFPLYQSCTVLNHSWSLSIEEQYYLFWPFILKKVNSTKLLLIISAIICLICAIVRTYSYRYPDNPIQNFSGLFSHIDAILVGSIGAVLSRKLDLASIFDRRSVVVVLLLSTAALYFFIEYANREMIFGFVTIPFTNSIESICILIWLIYSVTKRSILSRFLNLKLLRYIGLWSYSIYIWQQLFLLPFTTDGNYVALSIKKFNQFPLSIVLMMSVALLSYYLIEKPLQRLKTGILTAK